MLQTSRLFLVPATLPMLDAIVDENWPALSSLLGGVTFAENWFHFPEAFLWMRDFAMEYETDMSWWNYLVIHAEDTRVIGSCGYKGAPGFDAMVEIGYEIAEAYQRQGLATEAAQALCDRAFSFEAVNMVCAHTLAEENPSVKLLRRLGFQFIQEMIDIEDGTIWEWHLKRTTPSPTK
jgi:ribosomal-protein-alanine N-acetyltransferase